jgi:hypothetical protein
VGYYHPYGARQVYASNCPRETEKKRKTLKFYGRGKAGPRTTDDGQHAFIDEAGGKYRCKWCAGAPVLIRKLEKDVREHLKGAKKAYRRSSAESKKRFHEIAGFAVNKPLPKIQTFDQLIKLRKACSKLSYEYEDKEGVKWVKVFDEHSFAHNENKRKWGPRRNSVAQATGLLIKRSKQGNVVKGLCQFCGKVVFSAHEGRAAKSHAKCYQGQPGFKNGLPPETPKPWRPTELENLRKHYSWAMRHKLGKKESYGDLAKEFGVAKETVVNGIESFIARLPDPEMVNKQFRDRILRLRSPASN